jgi:hypothetical protein
MWWKYIMVMFGNGKKHYTFYVYNTIYRNIAKDENGLKIGKHGLAFKFRFYRLPQWKSMCLIKNKKGKNATDVCGTETTIFSLRNILWFSVFFEWISTLKYKNAKKLFFYRNRNPRVSNSSSSSWENFIFFLF